MFDQMKKLMEMKQQADKIKRQLETMRAEVQDVDGIQIVIDGAQRFHSITINEQLIDLKRKEALERDLVKSLNKAIARSQSMAADQMKGMMGLGGLPGF
ncbi:MAG TPA: YbaB/EbfC family nucleoid-associated protein [Candidatus Omnitrophota bacterium]|nr:YbaB/EbfC family nucleoid-associated protein [Candidatus Omnitrophota bacterium]HQL41092.1 YbaB/EbfC family nucleoid-associated protein [Candidatus Omnitrophota bacterium]